MTFIEAMQAAHDAPEVEVRVYRPDGGPELTVDHLGQVREVKPSRLYLGDILDLGDWRVEVLG